ncbi:UNVERIFIED_CONTAM: hypothetical protein Sradi_2517700 [Sesamum radiatum]|uniref:Reverse transcriptase Ty1/copia-type domain-containing protein n=1 Tax=Sesamum radiatum TaxID=300843 RepID=A0AAW2SKF7_SESRA
MAHAGTQILFFKANQDTNWKEAMQKELAALESSRTWDLTTLAQGKRAIGSCCVYELKHKPDGNIECYKTSLVAKGYTQIEGVDYFDSFSLVAKTVMVHSFLPVASAFSWPIMQLDTKYLCDILVDCHMTKAKPTSMPLHPGIKFEADVGPLSPQPDRYRRLVGQLLYLGFSHPNISFTVQQLNQFIQSPRLAFGSLPQRHTFFGTVFHIF